MKRNAIATLRFSMHDQRKFARWSGDENPIHLDPLVARRFGSGEPVVHGIHVLLRALDAHLAAPRDRSPLTVDAAFLAPLAIDETAAVIRLDEPGSTTLSLDDGSSTIALSSPARFQPTFDAAAAGRRPSSRHRPATPPLDRLAAESGVLSLPRRDAGARMFPHASRRLGADAVAAIGALSRLVGMECPGRDSLLSSVHVTIEPHARMDRIAWRVSRVDHRFGLVRMDVSAGGLGGTIEAFVRPRPRAPLSFAGASDRVVAGEFDGQRAIVVGGSRGIGAVTATLLAAGGGATVVTYASGRADAERLRRAVKAGGGKMDVAQYDVVTGDPESLARLASRLHATHLYYFATPRIFVRPRDPAFDRALFDRFADYYVDRFARLCRAIATRTGSLQVFYPSTVALDETGRRDLAEYAAAKAAGESICRVLTGTVAGLDVCARRLPRIDTDQTATVLRAPAIEPADALLPILRELHCR